MIKSKYLPLFVMLWLSMYYIRPSIRWLPCHIATSFKYWRCFIINGSKRFSCFHACIQCCHDTTNCFWIMLLKPWIQTKDSWVQFHVMDITSRKQHLNLLFSLPCKERAWSCSFLFNTLYLESGFVNSLLFWHGFWDQCLLNIMQLTAVSYS